MDGRTFPRRCWKARCRPRVGSRLRQIARCEALGPYSTHPGLTRTQKAGKPQPGLSGFSSLDSKTFNPVRASRRANLCPVGSVRRFPGRTPSGRGGVLHRHSAAQCHGAAAYRPRPQQHAAGCAGALRAHARQGCAVASPAPTIPASPPNDRRAPVDRAARCRAKAWGAKGAGRRCLEVEGGKRRRHCRAATRRFSRHGNADWAANASPWTRGCPRADLARSVRRLYRQVKLIYKGHDGW